MHVFQLKGSNKHYNIITWFLLFYAWPNMRRQLLCLCIKNSITVLEAVQLEYASNNVSAPSGIISSISTLKPSFRWNFPLFPYFLFSLF